MDLHSLLDRVADKFNDFREVSSLRVEKCPDCNKILNTICDSRLFRLGSAESCMTSVSFALQCYHLVKQLAIIKHNNNTRMSFRGRQASATSLQSVAHFNERLGVQRP